MIIPIFKNKNDDEDHSNFDGDDKFWLTVAITGVIIAVGAVVSIII